MLYYIMEYCCFGKKVRKEKQLLKAIKDNVLELSKEEAEPNTLSDQKDHTENL